MERSNLFVLSIVAVVAVVGFAMMFLQGSQSGAPAADVFVDEEGNLAGQAYYGKFTPRTTKAEPPRSFPLEKTTCDEIQGCIPAAPEYVLVTRDEIVARSLEARPASEICRALGYRGCVAGELTELSHLFATIDGSCRDLQDSREVFRLTSCTSSPLVSGAPCSFNDAAVEPIYGDSESYSLITAAICIR